MPPILITERRSPSLDLVIQAIQALVSNPGRHCCFPITLDYMRSSVSSPKKLAAPDNNTIDEALPPSFEEAVCVYDSSRLPSYKFSLARFHNPPSRKNSSLSPTTRWSQSKRPEWKELWQDGAK